MENKIVNIVLTVIICLTVFLIVKEVEITKVSLHEKNVPQSIDDCYADGELIKETGHYCKGFNDGYLWQGEQMNIDCGHDLVFTKDNCERLFN